MMQAITMMYKKMTKLLINKPDGTDKVYGDSHIRREEGGGIDLGIGKAQLRSHCPLNEPGRHPLMQDENRCIMYNSRNDGFV